MKDLDFDELDRAVNSLITNNPTPSDDTEIKEKTLEINKAMPRQQTVSSQQATPMSSSLAGRRGNAGRFMDVVHPSSDMRAAPAALGQISRQGSTINPVSKTPIAPNAPAPATPAEAPSATTNSWPDPIDFHEFKSSQTISGQEPSKEKDEDADIDQINDEITSTLNQSSNETPDSPFIAGTKVDKRPLGAFSDEQSATAVPASETPAKEEPKMEEKTNTDIEQSQSMVTPLPAELQNDLLSIESDDSTTSPEMVADASVVAPVATPAANVSVQDPNTQPVVTASITQQYKEQPSSGDQNSGAIYDTNAYHKALLHPAKKKSGWLWVLWIVILLVVGAGAGFIVYSFVLPNL
jgi:hypothetical protein